MATIAVLGTLDSKGEEHAYVAGLIRARGHEALLIDVGSGAAPVVTPDITREEVAAAAGLDLAPLIAKRDRGESVIAMSKAVPVLLAKLALGELAWGDVWYGGQTRNPWNLEQGASGSSAGPGSATAAALENTGVAAYAGAAPSIADPEVLAVALGIHSVEARHAAYLNTRLGELPAPVSNDMAKGPVEILEIAGAFFVEG